MSQERRETRGKAIIVEGISEEEEHHDMKPQLIALIKNNCSYGGNPLEDPKQHISVFLRTCGAVNSDCANHDAYKLLLFPFSLRDEAAQWLKTFPQESITSWDDLVAKFLAKFSSSQQNIKMKEGIHPFIQGEEEPLFKAWERHMKANDKVGFQAFYEGLTPETRRAVDYFSDDLLKATAADQGTAEFNDKRANNQHSFETPQNATSEKEIMNLEGMKVVMNQSKQLHQQTQQQLESIARQIDFLHSTTVNAQFPPWKPHSYLRMRESQHQEQRDFNYNNPNFPNLQKHHHTNNNQYIPPHYPPFQPPTPHNQPISQDSQRITNLEILVERIMKHQEMISKHQEASLGRIEGQIEQLAKNLTEMSEKRAKRKELLIQDEHHKAKPHLGGQWAKEKEAQNLS
ncbi:uncharacterized protein LOC130949677 [Arachis stenosperma]|uniref:uncharacterized protein LOC130949677 n=1 Tax=Arachis stenosperma TaxID=217475 RepID=UPI0025AC7F9D|nr:uncharacterized protein LOC130949677 [Arachis stenosperma]